MEQIIITGYIPFTDTQISFTFFAISVSLLLSAWFYWSLSRHLQLDQYDLPPTISPDSL